MKEDPDTIPAIDPIKADVDDKGNCVRVMPPRFAEGYEGYYSDADLAKRRKQIINSSQGCRVWVLNVKEPPPQS